jgi:AraC family transcriptional regulator of adaptative response/methylated-DNA-[protein]-cysteine methyltransferase
MTTLPHPPLTVTWHDRAKPLDAPLFWGLAPSPFGVAVLVFDDEALVGLAFADPGSEALVLADTVHRLGAPAPTRDDAVAGRLATRVFAPVAGDRPLAVRLSATPFERAVWTALLAIPAGATLGYGAVAESIGRPLAARAVGAAVGRNPVGWLVPCHRILGAAGSAGGYRWGLARKAAMLAVEGAEAAPRVAARAQGTTKALAAGSPALAVSTILT